MQHPPPPPRWLWFAAVAGLALLASLTIAAGRDPPSVLAAPAEPVSGATTGASSVTLLDPSPAFDRRCLVCQRPLN